MNHIGPFSKNIHFPTDFYDFMQLPDQLWNHFGIEIAFAVEFACAFALAFALKLISLRDSRRGTSRLRGFEAWRLALKDL